MLLLAQNITSHTHRGTIAQGSSSLSKIHQCHASMQYIVRAFFVLQHNNLYTHRKPCYGSTLKAAAQLLSGLTQIASWANLGVLT